MTFNRDNYKCLYEGVIVNWELPDVEVGFRKGRGPEIKLAKSVGSSKKHESSRKTSVSALLIKPKPLTVWITTNSEKFFKRWEYQTTWPASWEICIQVKKQQLELDMEQQTGSKLGKEYIKAVYCHPAYLICIQSTSCKMQGWKKHKLESRLLGEISITSDKQMTPPLRQKVKKTQRASWWKGMRIVKNVGLNLTFIKLRSWHPVSSLYGN